METNQSLGVHHFEKILRFGSDRKLLEDMFFLGFISALKFALCVYVCASLHRPQLQETSVPAQRVFGRYHSMYR